MMRAMKEQALAMKIAEREARLSIVEDILSIESHPGILREYRRQRTRLLGRIEELKQQLREEA